MHGGGGHKTGQDNQVIISSTNKNNDIYINYKYSTASTSSDLISHNDGNNRIAAILITITNGPGRSVSMWSELGVPELP